MYSERERIAHVVRRLGIGANPTLVSEIDTPADAIAAMLSPEELRAQLDGCNDSTCIAEVGGALGVDLMALTRVRAVGHQYAVNVKLLDVSVAKVIELANEMTARDEAQLTATVRRVVGKVCGAAPLVEASPPTVTAAAGPTGPGFLDVAPWVTLGLTVVAGGVALLYRLASFWLPIPAGLVAAGLHRHRYRAATPAP